MKMLRRIPGYILVAVLAVGGAPVVAGDVSSLSIKQQWKISIGGRLYDNWFAQRSVDTPPQRHPAYPRNGREQVEDTWRCTTCHGWHYRGVELGPDKVKIKGITRMNDAPIDKIVRILRDRRHGYTKQLLPDKDAKALAWFISKGQTQYEGFFNDDGSINGNAETGKRTFGVVCSRCHGTDGKLMNLGSRRKPKYVGTYAFEDPMLLVHKVRYGQPGVGMLSYGEFFERVALGDLNHEQDYIDVLAYSRSLPTE